MDGNRFAEAVTSFDRLLGRTFPTAVMPPPALFNAALSQEILGRLPMWRRAIAR